VQREDSFSEFESGFLLETKAIFGWKSSQDSKKKMTIRSDLNDATVLGKPNSRKKVSVSTRVNVMKGKAAETRNAIDEWNS
jgi:phage pi2 protein 07